MAKIQGTQVSAALVKAAAWSDAVAAGAGDGLYVKAAADAVPEREMVPDEALGNIASRSIDYGNTTPPAEDIVGDLYYEGDDLALALAMGEAGVPVQAASGSTGYDYVYGMADDLDGLFGTYVVQRGTAGGIFEYPSCKVHGFEMTGEAGGAIQLALKNIRDNLVRTSIVNTNGTFAAVTFPDRLNRVMFNQGTFRLNRSSAAALAGGDEVCPSSFTLAYTRPLEGDFTMCSGGITEEPATTGLIEVKLTLEFPQYDTVASQLSNYLAATNASKYLFKADCEFIGALIDGAVYRSFKFDLPELHLDIPASTTEGPGKIAETFTFTGLIAASAPLGMSGITKLLQLSGTNTRTTDPLA